MLPLKSASSARLTGVCSVRNSTIGRVVAAVDQLEVLRRQIGDRTAAAIAHGGGDRDAAHAGPERRPGLRLLPLRRRPLS